MRFSGRSHTLKFRIKMFLIDIYIVNTNFLYPIVFCNQNLFLKAHLK